MRPYRFWPGCMSRARNAGDERMERPRGDGDEPTTKVVMMELARASGPLTADALAKRTLLSEPAGERALDDLASADLCTVHPADDRRPVRYESA